MKMLLWKMLYEKYKILENKKNLAEICYEISLACVSTWIWWASKAFVFLVALSVCDRLWVCFWKTWRNTGWYAGSIHTSIAVHWNGRLFWWIWVPAAIDLGKLVWGLLMIYIWCGHLHSNRFVEISGCHHRIHWTFV